MNKKLFLISVMAVFLLTACKNSEDSVTGYNVLSPSNEAEIINNEKLENQTNDTDLGSTNDSNEVTIDNQASNNPVANAEQASNKSEEEKNNSTSSDDVTSNHQNEQAEGLPEADAEQGESLDLEDEGDIDNNQLPTIAPEAAPTTIPEVRPTDSPIVMPTKVPEAQPTKAPTAVPTKVPTAKPTKVPTAAPTKAPTAAPTGTPGTSSVKTLNVRGASISLGDSKSTVISQFGSPSRTDVTEYNYSFMVYNDNYKKFMMIAIADNKVVGWYTDATDFSYHGLNTSSKAANINAVFSKNVSLNQTIAVTDSGTKVTFFMDTLGDSSIDGVSVFLDSVTKGSTTNAVLTAWEKEVFDLTNSFRARNGCSVLSWSDQAAKSSKLHSEDMADNNYFSHTGLNGSTPSDRMKAQGINYRSTGENIIGGYGNAMFSTIGWVNSSGHRSNMLNTSFTYLGVGYALGGSYGNYATQNFFSK